MEENQSQNENEILEFQNWLEKNKWIFNEPLNQFTNTEKKEIKSDSELREIFDIEKKEELRLAAIEEEKRKKRKEIEDAFQNFLDKNKWNTTGEKDVFENPNGDKKHIMELVDDFKKEINKGKEQIVDNKKEEQIIVEEKAIDEAIDNKIKEVSESDGIKKLNTHKYQGRVKRYDLNPKEGTMMKKVILYGLNQEVVEEFCFKTKYEVN